MSLKLEQKKDYEFCTNTIQLKKTIEMSFLQLGKNLREILENRLYLPGWETWYDYLNEGLQMQKSTASRLIGIYEKFILKFGFSEEQVVEAGGWSQVAEIAPYCSSREQAENLLEKAALLPRPALRAELSELKSGVPQAECLCDEDYYVVKICRKCNKRIQLFPEQYEPIKDLIKNLR